MVTTEGQLAVCCGLALWEEGPTDRAEAGQQLEQGEWDMPLPISVSCLHLSTPCHIQFLTLKSPSYAQSAS